MAERLVSGRGDLTMAPSQAQARAAQAARRGRWLPGAAAGSLTFFLLLGLYVPTLARGLTWANYGVDGGDLVTAAVTGGVPHPPGYPTYVLLLRLFLLVAPGDYAASAALFSAACAAFAGGLFAAWIAPDRTSPGWIRASVALATALAFGLGSIVWSQAIVAEVHGLNLVFVVAALWLVRLLLAPERKVDGWQFGLAMALGVGLGNHLTLVLMLVPVGAAFIARWRTTRERNRLLALVSAFAAGLLVYLYLPLSASGNPPVNWGNPQTLEGFLWTVSGRAYHGLAFALPLSEVPRRLAAWAGLLREAFGLGGVALGVLGLAYGHAEHRPVSFPALWMVVAYSAFALGYNTEDSIEYLIPAHLGFALWIGLGLQRLMQAFIRRLPEGRRVLAVSLPILALAGIVARAPATAAEVDASTDLRAQEYGLGAMQQAPEGAVLLAWQALDSFPLWYYHYGLGQRPDIAVIVVPLMQFDWYLAQLRALYPDLPLPTGEMFALDATRWTSPPDFWDRPVCFSEVLSGREPEVHLVCPGPVG